jgi:BirA family biotin operon repressor/biotin-[acetyl-CoA-carboxylase] ligase
MEKVKKVEISGLRLSLNGALDGGLVECHETLPSTQIRGKELAGKGTSRALVIAAQQTEGRGRASRQWESPKGSGIYFSILFRPVMPAEAVSLVNAAAALSVADAVLSLFNLELWLKWPNDLLIPSLSGYRKVCGILSESAVRGYAIDYCVTGIGINFYPSPDLPPELEPRVGWLCAPGEEADPGALLSLVVKNFFGWVDLMERKKVGEMLEAYRGRCASIGRVVKVETNSGGVSTLTGLCIGIGDEGELVVETPEGLKRFHAADVTHASL